MQPAPCQLAWLPDKKLVYHQPRVSTCDNHVTDGPTTRSWQWHPHALPWASPQRNVPLIRRTQSDGPHPIEETVHGWNGFRVWSDGLEASRASCNQTLVCSSSLLVFWTKPSPTILFPFVAFAVTPSVCVSAFLFAGEPRFGCIFSQQLTSAVALSNTGHFLFLYRFLKVKILKERPLNLPGDKDSLEYICCFEY